MLIDVVSWLCLLLGSFFCFSGGIGIFRFPDFFTRMHASGVTDTLGAGLILIGLMFQAGLSLVSVKLILILVFLLLTGPVSNHAMAKAALHSGHRPLCDQHNGSEIVDTPKMTDTGGGDVSKR